MARLRQTYANRYASAEATSAEFESVIRYLNSAELGNLTLRELMQKIFTEEGDLSLGVELRFNPGTGLEYRLNDDDEWSLAAAEDDIRGAPGLNVGSIEAPLFSNKTYFTGNGSQTAFTYLISDDTSDVLVWVNGLLLKASDYTYSAPGTTVTLSTAPANGASVLMAMVRTSQSVTYERVDYTSALNQVTFPFPHDEADELIVFVNGIFKREGGGYDYVRSAASGTVNMTTPQASGAVVTIMNVANKNIKSVTGLMLEEQFTTNGLIRLDKVSIADGAITQAKVAGLVAALALRSDMYVQSSTPSSPRSGSLWVNTSGLLPSLNFFDGTTWVSSNAEGLIPAPTNANALKFLRLNASATGFEYAGFDASEYATKTSIGAASGIAPLNSSGLLPSSVIPAFIASDQINGRINGSLSNTTYKAAALSGNTTTIKALIVELGAGSATVQLQVDGTPVGSPIAATTSIQRVAISNHLVNSLTAPKSIQLVVSGASSASDLIFCIETLITG